MNQIIELREKRAKTLTAQLYTIKAFLNTPDEIEASLKKVKAIGYKAVQLSGLGPIAPEHLKEITDRIGLTIATTHSSFEQFTNDIDKLIEAHKIWGCRYVGIGAMPKPFRTSAEGFRSFISQIAGPARQIREAGMEFIYHNHKFEFQKFDGITGMEMLINETNPEDFGLELDTYWVQAGGGNPVEWIRKVEGRMKVVHLKDMAIIEDQQVFAEIGQGNLNWPKIIKACRDTDVLYYCVEQDTSTRDPFTSLDMSFQYLKPFFID